MSIQGTAQRCTAQKQKKARKQKRETKKKHTVEFSTKRGTLYEKQQCATAVVLYKNKKKKKRSFGHAPMKISRKIIIKQTNKELVLIVLS